MEQAFTMCHTCNMHMYMYQHTLSNFPENCIKLEDPSYCPLSSLVGCLDYHTPDVDISFTYTGMFTS